ncbi:HNH homing endonuclease [Enterobacter phage EC-W2]|nr:HNH homing endonuclease [Enterobacter phage EC-W2]
MTQDELKYRLNYDPDTGKFTWTGNGFKRPSDANRMRNKEAGCVGNKGYVFIRLDKKLYLAHRLAFLYMLGYMPEFVDHRNRIRNDNKWLNLRDATRELNNQNVTATSNTGQLNITWVEKKAHYVVTVKRGNKTWNKTFRSLDSAIVWRDKVKNEYEQSGSETCLD